MKCAEIVGLGAAVCMLASAQFKTSGVINAAALPKGTVFLTFDDGPDEPGPDGVTQMEKVARYLYGPAAIPRTGQGNPKPLLRSIRATFATVTCHYQHQDKADPASSLCALYGDVAQTIASTVVQLGHDLINHSVNHIPLTTIQDPTKLVYEVGRSQRFIDTVRDNSPRLFRGPGLAFNSAVASVLNADSFTQTLTGPIDADVGGDFYLGGNQWIGGDWDCFAKGMSVAACGALYVDAIRGASHGVIVLLHVRTEKMTGKDGNPFALALIRYIVENLGPDYDYLPLDAIPGVHGDITAEPVLVSSEFGASDGQGDVVQGAISGGVKPHGVCKARGQSISCKLADGAGGFLQSSTWTFIQDSSWPTDYNSKFWLTDVNGDGRADLVFPASGTLWVAYNNGQNGFYPPLQYLTGPLPDPRYIHFGKIRPGRAVDMVVWTPTQGQPQVYFNMGVRFGLPPGPPAPAAPTMSGMRLDSQMQALQLFDVSGDDLADIVIPGGAYIRCAMNTGAGTFGALQNCSTKGGQFTSAQGWADPSYTATFSIANIKGPVITGGLPTGLIFTPVLIDPVHPSASDRYRFICNDCFTNSKDPAWKPAQRATRILWGDFDGTGVDSPCLVRFDGLYLGLTRFTSN